MTENTDPLLTGLRDRFARAVHGGDRARTATFINPHLQELGQCEWMESYSIGGGGHWWLKRMVLSHNDGKPTVRQHGQDRYQDLTFGEMLYRLQEYEEAQDALGYIRDDDDSGHAVGAPLFRDVAAAEGVPHDTQGRFVIPQNGHLIEDGEYPLEAFAIAAKGVEKKALSIIAAQNTSGLPASVGGDGYFELDRENKTALSTIVTRLRGTAHILDTVGMIDHLLKKTKMWPFYAPRYDYFVERYVHTNYVVRLVNGAARDMRMNLPAELKGYLYHQASLADALANRVILSAMLLEADRKGITSEREGKALKKAGNYYAVALRRVLFPDKNVNVTDAIKANDDYSRFLGSNFLRALSRPVEAKKIMAIADVFEFVANSAFVDLSALPAQRDIATLFENNAVVGRGMELVALPPYVSAGPG